jgi:glyoxylase-like metal-dependent hydrolase (beta-lactamase superfamily II)
MPSTPDSHPWQEIVPGIFSIHEKVSTFGQPPVNIYFIPSKTDGGLLFDAGYATRRTLNQFLAAFNDLVQTLHDEGRLPRGVPYDHLVTRIVLSHEHHDHASGAPLLRQYFPNAKLYASKEVAELLKEFTGLSTINSSGFQRIVDMLEQLLLNVVYRTMHAEFSVNVDNILQDGDRIECDDHVFRVMITPGHSPGQVLLYDENYKLLLCSDLVLQNISTWLGPPNSSYAGYEKSMARLASLDLDLMLTAHGHSITEPTARINELLKFRKLREMQIIATCNKPRSAWYIAWRIYKEQGIWKVFLAQSMVGLVVNHLVQEGNLKLIKNGRKTLFLKA